MFFELDDNYNQDKFRYEKNGCVLFERPEGALINYPFLFHIYATKHKYGVFKGQPAHEDTWRIK